MAFYDNAKLDEAILDLLTDCSLLLPIDQFANAVGIDFEYRVYKILYMTQLFDDNLQIDKEILTWCGFNGKIQGRDMFKSFLNEHNIDCWEEKNKNGRSKLKMLLVDFDFATSLLHNGEIRDTMKVVNRLLYYYNRYKSDYGLINNEMKTCNNKFFMSSIYKLKLRQRQCKILKPRKKQILNLNRELIRKNFAIQPINHLKREAFIIYLVGSRKLYVVRRQIQTLACSKVIKFPDAKPIVELFTNPNARALYNRLKEVCKNFNVRFHYNNINLGEDITPEDFVNIVLVMIENEIERFEGRGILTQ